MEVRSGEMPGSLVAKPPASVERSGSKRGGAVEQLHAENSILQRENTELKQLINKRRERMSGKRLVLKGKVMISTEELQHKLKEAEQATKTRKNKKHKRTHHNATTNTQTDSEDIKDASEDENPEIGDCIVVQFE